MATAGYNIAFRLKVGNDYLTFAGRTQDDLTIAARTRERLTKDDAGAAGVAITGQDVTFRATGLVDLSSSSVISRNTLISYALRAGSTAVFDFRYAIDGDEEALEGQCVITNYGESSNASDDATYTVDFRVVGAPEIATSEVPEEEQTDGEGEPAEE